MPLNYFYTKVSSLNYVKAALDIFVLHNFEPHYSNFKLLVHLHATADLAPGAPIQLAAGQVYQHPNAQSPA